MNKKAIYTNLFRGQNDTPILQEVENKYYNLSAEDCIKYAAMFIPELDKENLQTLANEFCSYDCGKPEEMTDSQRIQHYIHITYRDKIIIQLEKEYEQQNNITVLPNKKYYTNKYYNLLDTLFSLENNDPSYSQKKMRIYDEINKIEYIVKKQYH